MTLRNHLPSSEVAGLHIIQTEERHLQLFIERIDHRKGHILLFERQVIRDVRVV
ncbi:hypothetical protein D3C73_1340810 [compost metagenome]